MSLAENHNECAFFCPSEWMQKPIRVNVIGAGGSGSDCIDRLVRLHFGILKTGHPYGLDVTLYDGDLVSEPNIGRQRFTPYDIGYNKASLLIHRVNVAYNLSWRAFPEYFTTEKRHAHIRPEFDILITCVDSASLRVEIGQFYADTKLDNILWMDFGNDQFDGQFILGHLGCQMGSHALPNVYMLFPGLATTKDENKPSCSFAEAIRSQDLMINAMLVDHGVNLLWQLLRHGEITFHGGFVNAKTGMCSPLRISKTSWQFLARNPQKQGSAIAEK